MCIQLLHMHINGLYKSDSIRQNRPHYLLKLGHLGQQYFIFHNSSSNYCINNEKKHLESHTFINKDLKLSHQLSQPFLSFFLSFVFIFKDKMIFILFFKVRRSWLISHQLPTGQCSLAQPGSAQLLPGRPARGTCHGCDWPAPESCWLLLRDGEYCPSLINTGMISLLLSWGRLVYGYQGKKKK